MRSTNLDAVATLELIIRREREIQVWCDTCRVYREFTHADLVALAERVGPQFSLIDRRCRCRLTPGCNGWNRFNFKAGVFRPMSTPEGSAAPSARDRRTASSG
ncbi:hypothetical protein [Novosphingobium mangrovi (ex Huang et al. 2023)]|uniref:Uncharacterized protein n=1 Tax=Novosphingobium mangrovi (ex Huang et al. 2023) TaxID=2976432 RepID=A0ABT2I1R1_9SPHN|nr:hypothetical protein [Novosphingobium mangrovi (ex Huang et al. 2023)]MCT2398547.1 hypothetical protein [Novosphingobium mangrovi (ex Huang et al. 2023)]